MFGTCNAKFHGKHPSIIDCHRTDFLIPHHCIIEWLDAYQYDSTVSKSIGTSFNYLLEYSFFVGHNVWFGIWLRIRFLSLVDASSYNEPVFIINQDPLGGFNISCYENLQVQERDFKISGINKSSAVLHLNSSARNKLDFTIGTFLFLEWTSPTILSLIVDIYVQKWSIFGDYSTLHVIQPEFIHSRNSVILVLCSRLKQVYNIPLWLEECTWIG
jgi:hypothetical protein